MSRRAQLNSIISAYDGQNNLETFDYGIVIDVVTNIDHPKVDTVERSSDTVTDVRTSLIGAVFVKRLQDPSSNKDNLKPFFPKNRQQIQLPVIGETVKLYKDGAKREYERIGSHPDLNLGNYVEGNADFLLPNDEKTNKSTSKNYKQVESTGISNTSGDSAKKDVELGEYFGKQKIHSLRLYEGDSLYQSRFGQSLRFSAYNNEEGEFSPTIILRNRQNDETLSDDYKFGSIIEEDINKDGSIIVLSSNKYKMDFQPGRVDDKGNSDWKLDTLYTTLPQEYTGFDQMLLNSERIILSSKSQEMLFFSKGNFSIVSDSELTADISKGGKFDFGDEVWITTDKNDKNIWVNTGNGQVRLNTDSQGNSPSTKQKEPIVRGETLKVLLEDLIDVLNTITFATPSGPTAEGPIPSDKQKLREIKNRLIDIKSTTNFTE